MASGRVFEPSILFQTAPLISSTAMLALAYAQNAFFTPLLIPEIREKSNGVIPVYFRSAFPKTVWVIVGGHVISALIGTRNLLAYRRAGITGNGAVPWYLAGILLSAAHFLFVPAVAWKLKAMIDDESNGQSTRDLQRWLDVHNFRTIAVDFPGFLAIFVGVTKMLGSQLQRV